MLLCFQTMTKLTAASGLLSSVFNFNFSILTFLIPRPFLMHHVAAALLLNVSDTAKRLLNIHTDTYVPHLRWQAPRSISVSDLGSLPPTYLPGIRSESV